MGAPFMLPEVDEVSVTLVLDNTIDALLPSTPLVQRLRPSLNPFDHDIMPVAEHGFCALISVRRGQRQGAVLFDTGITPAMILRNLDALELRLDDVQAIVLSHGHPDHAMGLAGVLQRLGERRMPLLLHPDAYLERKFIFPNGFEMRIPAPRLADLRANAIEVLEEVGPSMLVNNLLLVSGEVARTTAFETGLSNHYARRQQGWEPDPLIMDDQCAIVNVRGKGLLVVTGCGHAGIINILRNAQRLTGVQKIHAVVGGFHLSGQIFERIGPQTVAALQDLDPDYVMPCHCTGWQATHQIARALPQAFIANSVGSTLRLSATA